ncbi:MAG: RelA/SpoT family protein [Patescibacteria group bacterium]
MSSLEKLLQIIQVSHPRANLDVVSLAYDFAEKAHQGQKRFSGEPYFSHPYAAALTLAEMKGGPNIVAAALLHDVPEETAVTIEELKKEFGADIAFMVEGVTKVGKVKYRGMERYIENLRKMFVAMAVDLRVILIRFADRLHNLQTLEHLPRDKQVRIAQESLEIYAPIANRLGIGEIKGKLEDAAFKYALPVEYSRVEKLAIKSYTTRDKYLNRIKKQLEDSLRKNNVEYLSIHGRAKHLYSLYRKLQHYDWDITKVYDLVALRVIVKDLAGCYHVLGIVNNTWPPLPGRIKDYIAQPKPNGYQSLHTTVITGQGNGEVVEFQIRTQEMHEQAEFGIAAHWHYDEAGSFVPDKKFKWVEELTNWQQEIYENQKYLEDLKIDVLKNRIFVFTPRGDVIDLPEAATPVDFAYSIHTDIGNKCTSALVNEQIVNLDYKLKNGDVVEILIDKNRKGPNPDWLRFVKSSIARSRIRAAAKPDESGSFLGRMIRK